MKGFASTRGKLLTAAATLAVAAPAGLTFLPSTASAALSGTLTGAGSTLVQPLAGEWATAFDSSHGGVTVSYDGVGSGTGITDISSRNVDFGASDAPMTSTQAAGCHGCVTIPWALTATGIGFNLPGVKIPRSGLKLNSNVLANIFLGKITTWNNPAIKALNKGVKLPNLKITTVHRQDGSGDTYAFTNYLVHVSPAWKRTVGPASTSVSWPGTNGVAETGNGGVVQEIKATPGAIGYAAVAFLIQNDLHAAAIKNSAGKFILPNLDNINAAIAGVKHVPANGLSIVDPPKKDKNAYPISTFTYAIVPKTGNKQAALLKAFITFAIGPGQSFGPKLDFVPLPKSIVKGDKKLVGELG